MNKTKKINTLIVGQGIAGSLVAFMLYLSKTPFLVIDPGHTNTSSRVAAGMFTPVSGKRKTVHPITLQQIPFAIEVYRQIEKLLGSTILHLHNIYQVYTTGVEKNELQHKMGSTDFAKYILDMPEYLPGIKQPFGAFEIAPSGWVDCELFIDLFAGWLKQNEAFAVTEFLYNDLEISNDHMRYHGYEFINIVFCEGYRAAQHSFFNNENIIPCKGDILTLKNDQPAIDRIVKKSGTYLINMGNGRLKAGSTYRWNNDDTTPDEADKKIITHHLDGMLENNYTVIDHRTGIRPTTKDREVIARQHPQYRHMFMLNGLGTKGILQGPWWAKYIAGLLRSTDAPFL